MRKRSRYDAQYLDEVEKTVFKIEVETSIWKLKLRWNMNFTWKLKKQQGNFDREYIKENSFWCFMCKF